MSLRIRLLAGLAALVILGLAAFGCGTYLSLDHFLRGRLDQQLTEAATGVANGTVAGDSPHHGDGGGPHGTGVDAGTVRTVVGSDLYVELLAADGTVLLSVPSVSLASSAPNLTGKAAVLSAAHVAAGTYAVTAVTDVHGPVQTPAVADGAVQLLTSGSAANGNERVAVVAQPGSTQAFVVAGSLRPITQTLHRLLLVELGAGAGVLLFTLGLGLVLARQATSPLEAIAATADAIAAGDLGRRLENADDRSEVGRVGVAINTMLNEIQGAFMRRDASEARLRRFVLDASHELSTPLTSIRGYAELFHRGLADRPADLAKAMQRIESEGARMGGLVDDLLLLASLDNGRPLQRASVDLAHIVADAAADLRAAAPGRPVTLETTGSVIVVGDENRLRQVVANLAANARRHTPPDTPIVLRARVDGLLGVVDVADEGPGLSPDAAAHVFDRFYRVDKARARADGGIGLGLSIVSSIAEAHGGRASLVTVDGQGSTFSVAIPLALPLAGRLGGQTPRPTPRPDPAADPAARPDNRLFTMNSWQGEEGSR